jgi:hypothetical protein
MQLGGTAEATLRDKFDNQPDLNAGFGIGL